VKGGGGKGKPVEGFPNGLPDLTPLGVRITLENMLGRLIILSCSVNLDNLLLSLGQDLPQEFAIDRFIFKHFLGGQDRNAW
jgi:hypothetical protein